jgi:hypothetical protein
MFLLLVFAVSVLAIVVFLVAPELALLIALGILAFYTFPYSIILIGLFLVVCAAYAVMTGFVHMLAKGAEVAPKAFGFVHRLYSEATNQPRFAEAELLAEEDQARPSKVNSEEFHSHSTLPGVPERVTMLDNERAKLGELRAALLEPGGVWKKFEPIRMVRDKNYKRFLQLLSENPRLIEDRFNIKGELLSLFSCMVLLRDETALEILIKYGALDSAFADRTRVRGCFESGLNEFVASRFLDGQYAT